MSLFTCRCVTVHRPKPHQYNKHHIVPKSWGGPNTVDNLVTLCPTGHENVHHLLNAYVRAGGLPPGEILRRYSRFTRRLAAMAWEARPSDKPPWTDAAG